MAEQFKVTPWKVEGKIDYDALEKQFGIKPIDDELLKKVEKYTGSLHWFLRRKIVFAQRELAWLLDEYEKGNKFYLYTGLAPSGQMHLGHLLPFIFTQWLQEKFGVEVLIQIPDEEKYWARQNLGMSLEDYHKLAEDAVLNIAAMGFNSRKTKIFLDTEYSKTLYKQAVKVAGHITFSTVKDAFGVGNDTNIGWIFYTSMQAVPAFLKSVEAGKNVPCLIPLGVDQDVHFRVARDVIGKLGYYKPAIIHNMFLPSLSGEAKMSASEKLNTIYLNDTPEEVTRKVNRALTGQQATAELQRKHGGDPDRCMVCQYYRYLFEPDDKKLEKIFEAERSGKILAGEHKADLAKRINGFLEIHKKRKVRAAKIMDRFVAKD
ncbi:MAG TPA: tryptophan--tRNA ligase [Candidatus Acidoferrum sp.]|nr:tryptophan--tRNA ligase [Candidatus Acidoferrum sp.]